MIRDNHGEQEICQKHNLPLEFENPDKSKSNQLYVCNQCIIEYYQPIPIQQIKQSNQIIMKQFEQQVNQNSKIWNISILYLISLREAFTKSIKNIENIIDRIRNQIEQTMNEFKNVNRNQKEGIQQAHKVYLESQLNHQRNIIQQIEVVKQNSSIDKLIQGLNEISLQQLNYDDQKQNIKIVEIQQNQDKDQVVPLNSVQQLKVKRYEYQLVPLKQKRINYQVIKPSYKQQQSICACAFNHDSSLFAAGFCESIKVFQFQNEKLKELTQLEGHTKEVIGLQFVQKPQQLISAGFDSKILIWQQENQKWKMIQQLADHTLGIYSLKLSLGQELLVSGSADKQIFFYQFQNSQWVKFQSITCPESIETLDINQQCNTLLVCGENDTTILIYQKDEKKNNEWKQKQIIQLQLIGFRIGFTDENQFIFIPALGKLIYIFDLNKQKDEFYLLKTIYIQQNKCDYQFFPIQSVESKNLFIVKSCENLIIFRKIGQSDFLIDQTIHFDTSYLFGALNSDGSYLITWDCKSEEIQIRKMFETDYKEK